MRSRSQTAGRPSRRATRQATRESAYAEFVTARHAPLRRLAYAVSGDWGRAEEILQGALTQLYVAWPRLERDGTEEAFVRRRIVRAKVRPDAESADVGGSPRDPLLEALLGLPPKQRKVVLLRDWVGLSDEEAADELGITVGSVRAHAARATGWRPADVAQETR